MTPRRCFRSAPLAGILLFLSGLPSAWAMGEAAEHPTPGETLRVESELNCQRAGMLRYDTEHPQALSARAKALAEQRRQAREAERIGGGEGYAASAERTAPALDPVLLLLTALALGAASFVVYVVLSHRRRLMASERKRAPARVRLTAPLTRGPQRGSNL